MSHLASRVAALFPDLCALAQEAGAAIMAHYQLGIAVTSKSDNSPVTAADLASDAVIIAGLHRLTPDIHIITEETFTGDFTLQPGAPFWCVDPLDGTKEFIAHSGEFTVNIGLIENGRPIIGIIQVPVSGEIFWGGAGQGAWTITEGKAAPIHAREIPAEGVTVVTSRYHGNAPKLEKFLANRNVARNYPLGSTLKFCAIAKGTADIYPHFGNGTREWDTAAGQAIVEAAGGSVQLFDGGALIYGKPELCNPPYLVKGVYSKGA